MERKEQIVSWLKEILAKNLSGVSYNAFIFGSQANKTSLSRSDIDLGIVTDDKLTLQQLSKISADIEELPMLYKIDLVNFNEVDSRFKSVALKNVEKL
ncbi:MAG: polymerase beta domain protein region [Mucilaginibacter sp.]|nr:polymerase beta domain protein region [Mucilaginibacter sp.]